MLEERECAPGDEMARGLVPRDEQGERVGHGLVGRERSPVHGRGDDRRHDVVGRGGPAFLDVGDQELVQFEEVVHAPARVVGRFDRRIRPAPEGVAIRVGDAEQLRDHEHGERRRHRVDEVDLAPAWDRLEHLARDGSHPSFEPGDRTGREPPARELAPERVPGRVHVEDRAVDLARTRAQRILDQHSPGRAEALGVAADLADLRVPGDRPRVRRVLTDRGVAPELGEDLEVVRAREEAQFLGVGVDRHVGMLQISANL
jgi:hypothetical protein